MSMAMSGLRDRLPRMKRWVAYAAVVGLAVLSYSGWLGYRYWTAYTGLDDSNTRLAVLGQALAQGIPELDVLREEIKARRRLQDEWINAFSYQGYPQTDRLLTTVFETAEETGVGLGTISLMATSTDSGKLVQYQTQTLNLSLSGASHGDIYQFLSRLHQKVPIFGVEQISLTGFGGTPSALVELRFYLAPGPIPEKEAPK